MNALDLARHPHEQFRGEARRLADRLELTDPAGREAYVLNAMTTLAYEAFRREIEPMQKAVARAELDNVYFAFSVIVHPDGRIERLERPPMPPDQQKAIDSLKEYIAATAAKYGFKIEGSPT